MLDYVSSRSLKDEKEGSTEDFKEENLLRKTIVRHAKAQVKGLDATFDLDSFGLGFGLGLGKT